MDVQIIKQSELEMVKFIQAECNKKEAEIFIFKNYIKVACKNASFKAHRKFNGKCFNNFKEALNYYKSAEMKAIINFAMGC